MTSPILSPERWRTLEPLLDAALEIPPEGRSTFIDEICGGDAALRAELAAMLDECAEDDADLSRPAAERFVSLLDERHDLALLRAALASQYAVGRILGQGGMGTVYLARDLRHERDVAVKVLAPELADDESAARFLGEIRLTARLRHPHILPLFDSGIAYGRPWYVTPYVEGGTLRDRLARDGVLPLADALRVLREVASALAYAHARGVVHRDVKPENVLIDDGGALLGDFGIARAIECATSIDAPHTLTALTAAGFGTPAYMAPEQGAPGALADHRVDLYALGVIAHEMLCGRPPLAGSVAEGMRAEHDPAPRTPAPRLHPDLPAEMAPLISRLLAEHPEDRIQSAEELLRELDSVGPSSAASEEGADPGPLPATSREGSDAWPLRLTTRRWQVARGTLVVVGALALAGATGWAVRTWRAAPSLSSSRVLVVPFENATGDPALAPLGRMAADWVAQGLARTGAVDVSSEMVPPDARGDRGLRAVARQSGAGTVVSGTYYLDGDSVRLQARVTNVADWTLLRPVDPVAAAREAPQTLLEPLRQRVMAVLAVTHDPRIEGWAMGAPPPTFEAYEQFVAGLDLFSAGDWEGALPLWTRAAALDSSYVQPILHSISGYLNLGRFAEADSLVRLVARRGALSPSDHALLDFQRGEVAGDNMASLAAARAMVRAAPGTQLPHYLHAVAALRVNRPREALEAASRTYSRGSRFGNAWSSTLYWGVVTGAHHVLGQHEAELQAARTARDLHPGIREILWFELRALAALGRVGEVEAALGQLEGLQATPSGRTLPGLFLQLADELDAHGHPESARTVLIRAERWHRTRGDEAERPADALYDLARTLLRLGDDDAAEAIFARLAAERPEDPNYPAYQAIIALRRRRPTEAKRIAERLRTLRLQYDHGRTTYARAQIAAQAGDLDLAMMLLRQAFAEGYAFGTTLHSAPEFAPLRDEPEFRELLRPKG